MNSNLQNKLQQFSTQPPEGVWNKIADALGTEETFAQRLSDYVEQPPAAVWQGVENGLDESEPARVIPFATRFKRPIRYAAVACFLAIVLVTITLTFRRTEAGSLQAIGNTTVPVKKASDSVINQKREEKNTASEPFLEPAGATAQSTKIKTSSGHKKAVHLRLKTRTEFPNDASERENQSPEFASLNNYTMYSDGDGNVMKLSKKLLSLVNCKDGDGSCKQRLQELRQKMAAKAMTTDFTGILEMLRQLQ